MSASSPRSFAAVARRWLSRLVVWTVASVVLGEIALRVFVALVDVEHDLYDAEPTCGWITRPSLRRRIDSDDPPLHFTADTSSLGLRGGEIPPKKRRGEHRVLVLGDSFTWGIGVESTQTFPALLQARLRDATAREVTVINGGVPNYGTAQELAFYRRFAPVLQPDTVVLAYYDNDDDDNLKRYVLAHGYLWDDPRLILGQPSFLVELARRMSAGHPRPSGDGPARTLALLAELAEACERDGRALYVLQIPARESTRFALPSDHTGPYRPLALPAERLIEMRDELQRSRGTPYLREHHLNALGHRIAADVLARELLRREPLPLAPTPPRRRE